MADSLSTITARLRTEYPFPQSVFADGIKRGMTQSEYDAWIDQQAVAVRERQLADEAEAAEATRREQVKALYDALKAGTATNRQLQSAVAWLLRREIPELLP